jgi:hypothetical protein
VRRAEAAHRRGCLLAGRRIFGLAGGADGVSTDDIYSAEDDLETRTDATNHPGVNHAIETELYDTLLGAAAAGIAITVAPIAAAAAPAGPGAAQQSCIPSASGTVCQSPGNAEINDPPPPVSFFPYGGDAFLLGGYGGGFHGGGGHR